MRLYLRRKWLRDVFFRILCFFYRGFSLFGKKKIVFILVLFNFFLIKVFWVSLVVFFKFRLIDMVCCILGIYVWKYCMSVVDKFWYLEYVCLIVLISYLVSVVVVCMYYKVFLCIGVLWNYFFLKFSDIRMIFV